MAIINSTVVGGGGGESLKFETGIYSLAQPVISVSTGTNTGKIFYPRYNISCCTGLYSIFYLFDEGKLIPITDTSTIFALYIGEYEIGTATLIDSTDHYIALSFNDTMKNISFSNGVLSIKYNDKILPIVKTVPTKDLSTSTSYSEDKEYAYYSYNVSIVDEIKLEKGNSSKAKIANETFYIVHLTSTYVSTYSKTFSTTTTTLGGAIKIVE